MIDFDTVEVYRPFNVMEVEVDATEEEMDIEAEHRRRLLIDDERWDPTHQL
jgi:hypothetical protein